MKSQEELTGLSSEDTKINEIMLKLDMYFLDNHEKYLNEYNNQYDEPVREYDPTAAPYETFDLYVKIPRYNSKILITEAFGYPVDDRVCSKYIRYMLAENIFVQNPTSLLSSKKKIIKASDNTMYFVNPQGINEKQHYINNKLKAFREKSVIHIPKLNLMTYINNQDTNTNTNSNPDVNFQGKASC